MRVSLTRLDSSFSLLRFFSQIVAQNFLVRYPLRLQCTKRYIKSVYYKVPNRRVEAPNVSLLLNWRFLQLPRGINNSSGLKFFRTLWLNHVKTIELNSFK